VLRGGGGECAGQCGGRERGSDAVGLRFGDEEGEPAVGELDRGPAGTGRARCGSVFGGDDPAAEECVATRGCLQAECIGDFDLARGLAFTGCGGRGRRT
jgi:hypothetical protein